MRTNFQKFFGHPYRFEIHYLFPATSLLTSINSFFNNFCGIIQGKKMDFCRHQKFRHHKPNFVFSANYLQVRQISYKCYLLSPFTFSKQESKKKKKKENAWKENREQNQ